ncbi:MAG TPA: UDP-N-acetylglucosamine 2-epimerase, partial [Pyrinomonadaceae bacterium]
GTNESRIVEEIVRLFDDKAAYATMAEAYNPYGDGKACPRIVEAIAAHFCLTEPVTTQIAPAIFSNSASVC